MKVTCQKIEVCQLEVIIHLLGFLFSNWGLHISDSAFGPEWGSLCSLREVICIKSRWRT